MPLEPVMNKAEITAFLDREFPQIHIGGRSYHVAEVGPGRATLRLEVGDHHLRPGGTVSGPSMFALADLAAYVTILAHIGPVALAVTTNLNINFLRKPPRGDLYGHCRLLKLGRRLAVTDVSIRTADDPEPVAQATATYSIPPRNEL